METVAYYVAKVSLVTVPAAVAAWFLVHLFVPWWRRVGPIRTSLLISIVVVAIMWGTYFTSEPLLRLRFGVKTPLICISAVIFGIASYLLAQVHREMPASVFLGLPEISTGGTGKLVTGGIYSRMRHPRYVGMWLAVTAMALFTNYLSLYVLAASYAPMMYLVILLEEQELVARFGASYQEYCREVPRFLPRMAARRSQGGRDSTTA